MVRPTIQRVVRSAEAACRSLSRCNNFFNFDETDSWLGWENWLTIDIIRRLNHRSIVRFGRYPSGAGQSDILVRVKRPIAVEIKVNYVDDDEVEKWGRAGTRTLPERVVKDLRKLVGSIERGTCLMLVATGIESPRCGRVYKNLIDAYLKRDWGHWKRSWSICGRVLLLSMQLNVGPKKPVRRTRPGPRAEA